MHLKKLIGTYYYISLIISHLRIINTLSNSRTAYWPKVTLTVIKIFIYIPKLKKINKQGESKKVLGWSCARLGWDLIGWCCKYISNLGYNYCPLLSFQLVFMSHHLIFSSRFFFLCQRTENNWFANLFHI